MLKTDIYEKLISYGNDALSILLKYPTKKNN
jgi:hypothetical protein